MTVLCAQEGHEFGGGWNVMDQTVSPQHLYVVALSRWCDCIRKQVYTVVLKVK